jgi:hypothetical protein
MKITTDNYFGGCPRCGGNDGYYNIGKGHWFVCDRCKTVWLFGSNIFSTWRDEDEDTWRRNHRRIADYEEVEPIHPQQELTGPITVSAPYRRAAYDA